jgi:hypothetical protein
MCKQRWPLLAAFFNIKNQPSKGVCEMDLNVMLELLNSNTVFGALFIYLFWNTLKTSSEREAKLMAFLEEMKNELTKLSGNLGKLEEDVQEIKGKLVN